MCRGKAMIIEDIKEKDYIDYKYRKQKYLIDLDWQGINANSKEKIKQKYISFYIYKMDLSLIHI